MKTAAALLVLSLGVWLGSAHALDVRKAPQQSRARTTHAGGKLVVDVWTDRGDGAVYHIGDPIRVHFRASHDAYVILYNVDTEGRVHLLFPQRREEPHWVQGGRDYGLPNPDAPYDLEVNGPAGVEYIQALVSLEPFQQLPDYLDPEYVDDAYDEGNETRPPGWIEGDPFVGMDRINRSLLPYDCDEQDCYAAGYTTYYVERKTPYPRYLCADCHGPYASSIYDPYDTRCSVFEIRVDYDWRWRRYDPFYSTPFWYYFRRPDCPPRFYSYKQRWSSSDGWVRFKDTFGERVLWKKNPGEDLKGNNGDFRRPGSGGGGGSSGGGTGGGRSIWRGGSRTPPGLGPGGVRPDPVRVPVQPAPEAREPVRFRSKSRDVDPPGQGRRGRDNPPRVQPRPAPSQPPPSAPPEQPRRVEGRKDDAEDRDRGRDRVKPEPAPRPEKPKEEAKEEPKKAPESRPDRVKPEGREEGRERNQGERGRRF